MFKTLISYGVGIEGDGGDSKLGVDVICCIQIVSGAVMGVITGVIFVSPRLLVGNATGDGVSISVSQNPDSSTSGSNGG